MERQWKYIGKRLKLRLHNARGIWLLQISPTWQKHTLPTSLGYASVLQRVSCSLWRSLHLSKWPKWPVPRCTKSVGNFCTLPDRCHHFIEASEENESKRDKTTAQWYHKSQSFGMWTMLIYVVHIPYLIYVDLCVFIFLCSFHVHIAPGTKITTMGKAHRDHPCNIEGEHVVFRRMSSPLPYLSCLFTVLGIWLTCFIPLQYSVDVRTFTWHCMSETAPRMDQLESRIEAQLVYLHISSYVGKMM